MQGMIAVEEELPELRGGRFLGNHRKVISVSKKEGQSSHGWTESVNPLLVDRWTDDQPPVWVQGSSLLGWRIDAPGEPTIADLLMGVILLPIGP
jgi:hypothetical protein